MTLSIQFWPLERLIPYVRNARTHSDQQVAQIAASIAEFGFNNPVLAGAEGGIIAGHGRVLAARRLGLAQVPVVVLAHLSENQKRAFALADNKLTLNAGWDEQMLCLELEALAQQDFSLELTGFSKQEIEDVLAQAAKTSLRDADEIPEPDPVPVSRAGEIWVLGAHRLLCGDAMQMADVDRVLEHGKCDLIFTDPPYNVNYSGKTRRKLTLVNDNLGSEFQDFLAAACASMLRVSQGPLYICMSSGELHHLYTAFTSSGGHWSTYVMWAKNTFTLGRSDYQRQYEPILYGWPEGIKHFWCGDRDQGDVWSIDKPRVNDLHPTMKPVALVERAVENSSRRGEVVFDPFAGSGSTLIACENLGRRGRAIELDPRYVDVIIRRWQAYTGAEAALERGGRCFDQIASERLMAEAA